MTEEDRIGLLNEIDILKQVDHPNIVKLIDVYEDSQTFSLVLELMTGGELFETILEKSSFSEQEAKELILPIVDAIKYCHSLGIVHRDIKPENLLFSSKDPSVAVIKVSDFGLARTIEEDQFAQTTCGTPGYVAPEILEQLPYTKTCDYWSIGVVLFILLSGCPPFYDEDNFVLFEKIKNVEFNFDAPAWKSVSSEAKDIICKLLVKDPEGRLTPDEFLAHPWITGDSKKTDIGGTL